MKKKGFTLIELLAAIIVLGIIALIAVPAVTNIINEAKENAAKVSAQTYVNAVENYIMMSSLEPDKYNTLNCEMKYYVEDNQDETSDIYLNDIIKMKGSYPTSGYVIINSNNKIEANIVVQGYNILCIDDKCNVEGKSTIEQASCDYEKGYIWNFDYTGNEQEFTVPCSGTYKLETWGAQGSGYGGYSVGHIELNKNDIVYINVGGAGTTGTYPIGGYNGGGNGRDGVSGTSGGGATHIAKVSGVLADIEMYKGSLRNDNMSYDSDKILIVAGGGGGSTRFSTGAHGGGYLGNNGSGSSGGSQTEAGSNGGSSGGSSFGKGSSYLDSSFAVGGGGGGWYGGGSAKDAGGSGGSGYIGLSLLTNKVMYCYNCTESSDTNTKTISTTCHSSTPTENCAKEGNGYAKITLISLD